MTKEEKKKAFIKHESWEGEHLFEYESESVYFKTEIEFELTGYEYDEKTRGERSVGYSMPYKKGFIKCPICGDEIEVIRKPMIDKKSVDDLVPDSMKEDW